MSLNQVRDQKTGEPKSVILSSAAMTSSPNQNPTAKMYFLDPESFTPVDGVTYSVDLAKNGSE